MTECVGALPNRYSTVLSSRIVSRVNSSFRAVSGRLAQLVARFLHTEEVVGSSPASPTLYRPTNTGILTSSH